jgi:hypothetical protein
VHELLVGVVIAPPRAGDELRLVLWPAHHCGIYTQRDSLVPMTRAVGIDYVPLEVDDVEEALEGLVD